MKKYKLLVISILISLQSVAQIGVNNNNPNKTAVLDIYSLDDGFLVPRMTSSERLAIVNPANSLLVFDLDDQFFYFYDSISTTGENWTGVSPWLFRDDNPNDVGGIYYRDLCTHSSVRSMSIGTYNPTLGNKMSVVGSVSIGDSVSVAPTNGLHVVGELDAQKNIDVTGKIIADKFAGFGAMPIGGIIMWSGDLADLPEEWRLCNGDGSIKGDSIPDLRGKFITAYNDATCDPADKTTPCVRHTGGKNEHVLVPRVVLEFQL